LVRGVGEIATRPSPRSCLRGEEAHLLYSIATKLRFHEVVDTPNWVVKTAIPPDFFPR